MFVSAFVSATLLPGSSELVLVASLSSYPERWLGFLLSASLGNTLGGMLSFAMGWGLKNYAGSWMRWLPSEKEQQKAAPWLRRFGVWSLLLSWTPIIGDGLCLLAGAAKLPWLPCLLIMALGKFIRYGAIIGLTFHWF
ncbi:DedA family protein [Alginatibacterium sediminis]|uniref:DedA family protein n=1 Tax=Alginatibacterium sediminis TaxID=2164068 RepID=A0A420EA54_9ALTE|nr:DedA family protein [Alginatibacterium sediminis]